MAGHAGAIHPARIVPPRRDALARAILVAGMIASCGVALAASPLPAHAAKRRKEAPPADSVVTRPLAELPGSFVDRFVTGVALAGAWGSARPLDAGISVSPHGDHMAFVHDLSPGKTMVVDGVAGKSYIEIERGVFSPEGGHFAYTARPSARGGLALSVDGREIAIDDPAISAPLFNPDGRHYAYVASDGTRLQVVSDRHSGRLYDRVRSVTFSGDGERLAYVGSKGQREVVVIDEVEGPPVDEAGPPVFDPSGAHVAYALRSGTRWRVMRDGKLGEAYDLVDPASLSFSRNGAHLAYVARLQGDDRLVIDDRPLVTVNGSDEVMKVAADTSVFSPDGRHFACWVRTWNPAGWQVVVDGRQVGSERQCIGRTVFSLDGGRFAYTECVGLSSRWRVVVDGTPGSEFDSVGVPRFSEDGRRLAYRAAQGSSRMVVVDGASGPSFDAVGEPVPSPDGKHVAYLAAAGGRGFVVVDGRRGPEFDAVIPNGPVYRADGSLEYLAVSRSMLIAVRHIPR